MAWGLSAYVMRSDMDDFSMPSKMSLMKSSRLCKIDPERLSGTWPGSTPVRVPRSFSGAERL